MKRRQLLLGLGSVAGAGSVLGSGAFTSVSADRTVRVNVADDANALLTMQECDGPNGDYVTTRNGTLTVDLSPSSPTAAGGEGVNADATTVFDDVFELVNQGTQPVGVWLDVAPVQNGRGNPAVEFYRDGDRSTDIVGPSNAACLGVGESVCVGFVTRTYGMSSGDSLLASVSDGSEMVVHADADVGCGEGPPIGEIDQPRSLSTGTADWLVTSLPETDKEHPTPPYGAYVVDDPPDAWATAPEGSSWVDPFGDGGLVSDPASETPYVYELEFFVPTPKTLVVDAYGSDNPIELYLDGRKIGGSNGANAYDSLRTDVGDQALEPGRYTLRAVVTNEPGSGRNPTGLLVSARLVPVGGDPIPQ